MLIPVIKMINIGEDDTIKSSPDELINCYIGKFLSTRQTLYTIIIILCSCCGCWYLVGQSIKRLAIVFQRIIKMHSSILNLKYGLNCPTKRQHFGWKGKCACICCFAYPRRRRFVFLRPKLNYTERVTLNKSINFAVLFVLLLEMPVNLRGN